MIDDKIVQEVQAARQQHAAQFNYDLSAIAADLKRQERASKSKFVKRPPRQPITWQPPDADQAKPSASDTNR